MVDLAKNLTDTLLKQRLDKQANPLLADVVDPTVSFQTASNPIGGMNAAFANLQQALNAPNVRAAQQAQANVDAYNQRMALERDAQARTEDQQFKAAQAELDRAQRASLAADRIKAQIASPTQQAANYRLAEEQRITSGTNKAIEALRSASVDPTDFKTINEIASKQNLKGSEVTDLQKMYSQDFSQVVGDRSQNQLNQDRFKSDGMVPFQTAKTNALRAKEEELLNQGLHPSLLAPQSPEISSGELPNVIKKLVGSEDEDGGIAGEDYGDALEIAKYMYGKGIKDPNILQDAVILGSREGWSRDIRIAKGKQAVDKLLEGYGIGSTDRAKNVRNMQSNYQSLLNEWNRQEEKYSRKLDDYVTKKNKENIRATHKARREGTDLPVGIGSFSDAVELQAELNKHLPVPTVPSTTEASNLILDPTKPVASNPQASVFNRVLQGDPRVKGVQNLVSMLMR